MLGGTQSGLHTLVLHFFIILAYIQFIKEKHSNEEAGQPLRFGFDEDGRVLELIMDHPQDKSFTGWEVLPDVEPLTV